MEDRKVSLSFSEISLDPSSLLGVDSAYRLRLPHPRLLRVSTPVTLFLPDAYRQRACTGMRQACREGCWDCPDMLAHKQGMNEG